MHIKWELHHIKKLQILKKKNLDKITGDDWAAIRNFKKTILEKNTTGIAVCLDEIRCLLNKITIILIQSESS